MSLCVTACSLCTILIFKNKDKTSYPNIGPLIENSTDDMQIAYMLLTTSVFQEFWLGMSSAQMEELLRLDPCIFPEEFAYRSTVQIIRVKRTFFLHLKM